MSTLTISAGVSDVQLSVIRFPRGNVAAKFEDIRRVLEREKVLRT